MTTREITVTVAGKERRFNLHPMTIREALDLLEASEKAHNAARTETKGALGDPIQLTLSSRAYFKAAQPTIMGLLSRPADEGQPLSEEDYWSLDARDPGAVIAAQEDFVQMRTILAGGQLLVEESVREAVGDAARASQQVLEQIQKLEE